MTTTDRSLLKSQEAGALVSAGASDPIGTVAAAHSETFTFDKASADAMASTTTSETYVGVYVPRAAKLKSVTFVPTSGGLTADDTNYATVTVKSRDSGGANAATVATLTTTTTSSGSLTQGAGKALVLTAANVLIAAGSTFTLTIAKASSGVVVPAGRFTLDLEYV